MLNETAEHHILESAEHSCLFSGLNLEPPNPSSLRFHKRIGFKEIGRVTQQLNYSICIIINNISQAPIPGNT